jgi:hypothetical protein
MLLFPNSSISLLQSSTAIPLANPRVSSIPLAGAAMGTGSGTAIGWGQTSHPGSAATNLQFLNVPIIANDVCRRTWGQIGGGHICTFSRAGQGEKNDLEN